MQDFLEKEFLINIRRITSFNRIDMGNNNKLFKIDSTQGVYFLKEIPAHSLRDNLEEIYTDLRKHKAIKFSLLLPIQARNNKNIIEINNKKMMLYPFIEHEVVYKNLPEIEHIFKMLDDLFESFGDLEIPKHPFKTYRNWYTRGVDQLKAKIGDHEVITKLDKFINSRFEELDFQEGGVHFDLNPFNVWRNLEGEFIIADCDSVQQAAYAKDIFDICSSYLEDQGKMQAIHDFAKKYIKNLEITDTKLLMLRPRLGELFNPQNKLDQKALERKLDQYNKYLGE